MNAETKHKIRHYTNAAASTGCLTAAILSAAFRNYALCGIFMTMTGVCAADEAINNLPPEPKRDATEGESGKVVQLFPHGPAP